MTEIKCWTCGRIDFINWGALADHKLNSKDKEHRKDKAGRIWAANYKYKHVFYDKEKKDQVRTPLTDEQREAKEDTHRELSGQTKLVPVKCPRCRNHNIPDVPRYERLEIEHVNEPNALRIDNCFVKMCNGCRS